MDDESEDVTSKPMTKDKLNDRSYPLIVIGASAGGFEVIKEIVANLPKDFHAAIFIVWHISPSTSGILPQVLNRYNTVVAGHGYDGEAIKPQRIYVAPPDRHMLLDDGIIKITRGPKENRFRPAIDPLFRSAAFHYRTKVTGIILSGALDDGTAGLWTIKHFGGTAIVQDPAEAEVKGMPQSAIRQVKVDYCLTVKGIIDYMTNMVEKKTFEKDHEVMLQDKKTEAEIKVAGESNALEANIMKFGSLTPFTCPECHGVLTALNEEKIRRYRCHTGHAFSADSLLDALTENIEESLYSAIRGVDESIMLLNHMGDHFAEMNETKIAALYFMKAKEASDRSNIMRQAVLKHEHLSKQTIEDELKH
ncbi:MAG TPA: chemotaxis protein CheB [Flavitalea sp.]|nr:chemotaxis protein CheB [Flavitalea sp.]